MEDDSFSSSLSASHMSLTMDVPLVIKCKPLPPPKQGRRNSTTTVPVIAKKAKPTGRRASVSSKLPSTSRSDTFRSLENFLAVEPLAGDGSNSSKGNETGSTTSVILSDKFAGLDVSPAVLKESLRVARSTSRRHSYHSSGRSRSFDDFFVPSSTGLKNGKNEDDKLSCSLSGDETASDIIAQLDERRPDSFKLAKAARIKQPNNSSSGDSKDVPPRIANRRGSYHGPERTSSSGIRRSSDPGPSASDILGGFLGKITSSLAEELTELSTQDEAPSTYSQDAEEDSIGFHDFIYHLDPDEPSGSSMHAENRKLRTANKQLALDMERQDKARREEIASLKAELKSSKTKNISLNKISEAKDAAVEKLTKNLEKRDATIAALQDSISDLKMKIGHP